MIGRRSLLAGLTALPLAQARAAPPVPASNRLAFHIIRKGSTIGEHSVDFAQAGDALTVSVAADIVVGIGPDRVVPLHSSRDRPLAGGPGGVDRCNDK